MTSYIVSLKYAPGLAKEFCLMGRNFSSRGATVRYVLSRKYEWLMPLENVQVSYLSTSQNSRQMIADTLLAPFGILRRLRELFKQEPPDFICIYNPHPLNALVLDMARRFNPECKRAIYLHEPYKPDKRSFGKIGGLYFSLVEGFQTRSINQATSMILPSPQAFSLFERRYPSFQGSRRIAPILLPDSASRVVVERKYISLVGTINKSRGLDTFIDLINFVASQGSHWQFLIMTRNDVQSELEKVSEAGKKLLTIVIKPTISDEELSDVVASSFAVFLPHKQVTQSGNVPVCFRVGTPLIARDLPGFSQHIVHKQNGYLLPYEFVVEQVAEAVAYVIEEHERLSQNAYITFDDYFNERNWERYYDWII